MVGGLADWEDALRQAGIEVGPASRERPPDLAVAPASEVGKALATGAGLTILEGPGGRSELTAAGRRVRRFLPLPAVDRPRLLVPLEQPLPARYALRSWAVPEARWKRLRNDAAAAVLSRGLAPPGRTLVTVGAAEHGAPFMVDAAQALGIPAEAGWFLAPAQGDALSRGVFVIFPPGARQPAWALKFARVPGYDAAFDRDERGLRLAREAGPLVAERAPELVGRLEVGDLHSSLETAATGQRLFGLLRSTRRPEGARALEEITGWLVELDRTTAAPPAALAPELARVVGEVLPRWGVGADAVGGEDALRSLRPVLQHNDLGSWNVVVHEGRFTVLDWEDAIPHGFPLWDLLYLATDALAHLDRVDDSERERHFVELFRGERASSSLLFAWTRRAAAEHGIPAPAVGALATLCWLHHGLSDRDRRAAAAALIPGSAQPPLDFERLARRWLEEPGLGPGWSRWQDN